MRLLSQTLLTLGVALVIPVAGIGLSAWRSMREIGETASHEARALVQDAEQGRLKERTRRGAGTIEQFLARHELAVAHLQAAFASPGAGLPGRPPYRGELGLPGWGYVDPALGAWADWDLKTDASLWVARPQVARVKAHPETLPALRRDIEAAAALTADLRRIAHLEAATVDLVWIVLMSGVSNAAPRYDYRAVVREDPAVLDLDESTQDYVRLLTPAANPTRSARWLQPYYDYFRGGWMTSRVAPLYDEAGFRGTAGVDVLLDTVTDEVLGTRDGEDGWAFLVTGDGAFVALPSQGIRALTWTEEQRRAAEESLRPVKEQAWTEELRATRASLGLGGAPDPARRQLAQELLGKSEGELHTSLGGVESVVTWAQVGELDWRLALVVPQRQMLAPARNVAAIIGDGTESIAETWLGLAVILVVGGGLVGLVLHARAVRPLSDLAARVQALDPEQLDLPAAGPNVLEIATLERRFRALLASITEHRRQLAAERELLDTTLRAIAEGVVTVDHAGRVEVMNQAALVLSGCQPGEAWGKQVEEVLPLVHRHTDEPFPDPCRKVLETGDAVHVLQRVRLRARDGSLHTIAATAAPIPGKAPGTWVGAVMVFRDMGPDEALEEELVRAKKLEGLQGLAAGIAHDFNNLLTGITANLGLAQRVVGEGHPAGPRIAASERSALRAAALTGQLLTFARGGAPLRKPMFLGPLLHDSATFGNPGSAVQVDVAHDDDLWPVNADEGQLAQVLNNLVLNAVEAGATHIRLVATNIEAGRQPPLLAPGRYVRVEVADNGPGVPAAIREKVWDPFYSTKERGSGLGLAVCFSVVRAHEGAIEVGDAELGGASFVVLLPAADEAPAAVAGPPPPARKGTRVLVMDDDPAVLEVAAASLVYFGYQVETAPEGEAAVAAYEASRPDVVILDLTVAGGLGGIETLARLRALDPGVRAIVSSGYAADPILAHAAEHGFRGALVKPWVLADLGRIVAEVAEA